jgi:transglutaminase-like putative cysteine protease
MKRVAFAGFYSWLLLVTNCLAQEAALTSANRLDLEGHFREAGVLIEHELHNPSLKADYRNQLEFELDRLDRIRKDFPYTEESLFAALKKSVKDLARPEFDQWIREGRFETRDIDGQRFFMSASVSNLFFRNPELYPRRMPPKNNAEVELAHWETCEAIKKAALTSSGPYVLPKRFVSTMSVTAEANAAPDGEMIRAWLPIPREYPFQNSFRLLSPSPSLLQISDEKSPARSAYFEEHARKGKPTSFKLEYEYTSYGVSFQLDPSRVRACDLNNTELKKFTSEAPHVVFTPEIRALSQEIIGAETNTCLKAKKFYDWISENIKYSYALEYSTVRNLSDYCRKNRYGDCGEEALLFITLCRLNGIPARWQSGWNTFPGAKSIHDWSEIYLAPYGWVPVDPYMGIYAMRYATSLKPEQQREIRDFYFGGLDQYRMVANSDHNQALAPQKTSMRSDNVDFQRGELEWGKQNIYFDQFSYELGIKELTVQP